MRNNLPSSNRSRVLGMVGLALFAAIWSGASSFVSAQFLPSPLAVAAAFLQVCSEPFAGATLPLHLLASLGRFAGGFTLAVLVGVTLGLAMGWFKWLESAVTPLFDSVRFISPIAWVAFAALWFGTGWGGPILIIFAGAFPACVINAYRGARFVDKTLIEAAQTMGASSARIIFRVLLPASIPSIVAGLRVAAGMAWQSLIGAELIVASSGIGYMMVQAQGGVKTSIVMAGMVAVGIVGLLIDVALQALEKNISRGRTSI